jgi:EpsI family protein
MKPVPGARRPGALALVLLGVMAAGAALANTVLFSQAIKGDTDLTRHISPVLGRWSLIEERTPSDQEYRGLETRDIVKRTYSDGSEFIELIVAYIPQSNRKSAHAQESCLRGSGALVGSIARRNLASAPVEATQISIEQGRSKAWVYYWFKFGEEHSSAYLRANLKMLISGLRGGKKSEGASLVRLLTNQGRGESPAKVHARLEEFAGQLVPELNRRLP